MYNQNQYQQPQYQNNGFQNNNQYQSWNTIESDPMIFTDLVNKFGVNNRVRFEEVFDLDQFNWTQKDSDVYGFILLFKQEREILEKWHTSSKSYETNPVDPEFVQTKQCINNSCATVAIVNIMLNVDVALDSFQEIKTAIKNLPDPNTRGYSLENIPVIKNNHNSFSYNSLIHTRDNSSKGSQESQHFISFVNFRDHLQEVDGLTTVQNLGKKENTTLTSQFKKRFEELKSQFKSDEIMFNVMAIVKDDQNELVERKAKIQLFATGISMVAMEKEIKIDIMDDLLDQGYDDQSEATQSQESLDDESIKNVLNTDLIKYTAEFKQIQEKLAEIDKNKKQYQKQINSNKISDLKNCNLF